MMEALLSLGFAAIASPRCYLALKMFAKHEVAISVVLKFEVFHVIDCLI